MSKKILAITTGDHRGIGPEIAAKAVSKLGANGILVFGDPELYKSFRKILPKAWKVWQESEFEAFGKRIPFQKNALHFIVPNTQSTPPPLRAAYASARYVELAVQACLRGLCDAMVTGPIDKTEWRRAGYTYDGHTEMLQDLCKVASVTMMLASPSMRVTLATTHVAVRDITTTLTAPKIIQTITNTAEGLKKIYGIKKPRIAVLALNPHGSDQGLFGDEEATKILPAINFAQAQLPSVKITGPHAPDGFFAQWSSRHAKNVDAIVCMYHDQGLIPVKLHDFDNTVNVTLGLPILRTSVDHGIGLDIVGKNLANPKSLIAAIRLALQA